jgi:hypothetical protein
MKGLARRNTHVIYESPSTNQSKVITKVKVFVDGQTHRQTDSDYYRAPNISGALNIHNHKVLQNLTKFSRTQITVCL